MHISDWYATLAAVAGVPATVLAASNASGPKPLDSFDMSGILLGSTGSNNDVRGDAGAGDNVNTEVGVNSIAYVGAGAGAGDGAAAATCGVDRLASPRTTMMYFYGDDHNGAYTSGDFKLVMGIDHKWGLWEVSCVPWPLKELWLCQDLSLLHCTALHTTHHSNKKNNLQWCSICL